MSAPDFNGMHDRAIREYIEGTDLDFIRVETTNEARFNKKSGEVVKHEAVATIVENLRRRRQNPPAR